MDPFTIAAIVAAVAGSGMQYKANTDAQKRQQDEIRRSLESQKALQMQAESRALSAADKFATPERQKEQQQIEDTMTQELMAPVSESQTIRAGQQTTQGNVSGDYQSAKAASDLNSIKTAQSLARMLGKTSSANRLRMNEGIRLTDAGQDIDRLGGFSRGQAGADQVAIQQAGLVDPGMMLAGSLLQTAGTAGMAGGGGAPTSMQVNAAPTIAGSPGLAPVFDVSKMGGNSFASAFDSGRSAFNGMFK